MTADAMLKKYLAEEYSIGWILTARLDAATVSSAVVTAETRDGEDMSDLLGAVSVSTPNVSVLLKKNVGTRGLIVFIRFTATLSDARIIEQVSSVTLM